MIALGIFDQILDDRFWITRVNLIVTVVFLFVAFCIFLYIFFKRVIRKRNDARKKLAESSLIEMINNYLFDEDADKNAIEISLRHKYNKPGPLREVLIEQFLNYRRNFSGEMADAVSQLFIDVGLKEFMIDELQSSQWHHRAKAFAVLADMNIPVNIEITSPRLNDRKTEVREQALLYHLKLARKEPLSFLDRITKPLSYWQQIYIENGLKYTYKGPDPDFSWWLDHHLDSVIIFSMKMIASYNQYEHIEKIKPLLASDNVEIRVHALRALYQLGYEGIFDNIQMKFKHESVPVKKEYLRAIEYTRSFDLLALVRPMIADDEWKVKLLLHRMERKHDISTGLQLATVRLKEPGTAFKDGHH